MEKINFQNGITPLNDTNLNQLQTNIENTINEVQNSTNKNIDNLENNKIDKRNNKITLYGNGWHRIAYAKREEVPACLMKLGTTYNNQAPMTVLLSIITSYSKASMSIIQKLLYSDNYHITQIRIQHDSETETFYLDVFYNLTNKTNYLYVEVISGSNDWKTTENTSVVEYETVATLSLT